MRRLWQTIVDFARGLLGFTRRRGVRDDSPCRSVAPRHVGHRLVTGPAGTGKSTILRNEAAAIMKEESGRLLVVTSSERVARSLRSLPGCDDEKHLIATARGLCLYLLGPDHCRAEEDLTGHLLNRLSDSAAPPLPGFPHILVDEAQNLSPALIRVIEMLAAPGSLVSYFADPAQAIFGFAGATSDTLSLLRALCGSNILRLSIRHRPLPVIKPEIVADTSEQVIETAVSLACDLGGVDGSVAILTRTNAEADSVVSLLEESGIKCCRLSAALIASIKPMPEEGIPGWQHYATRQVDIAVIDAPVIVSTVHTFRDRSADHVVVFDTSLRRPSDDPVAERRRIATGISRALRSATVIRLADTARFLTLYRLSSLITC